MGQKNVSQGDGGGTTNPEKEPDSAGDGGAVQAGLEEVDVSETDSGAESLDDMGVSERYQDAIEGVQFNESIDEEDAAMLKESLGRLATDEEAGLTESQIERLGIDGDAGDGLATNVMAKTWGSSDGTIRAGEQQRLSVQEDVGRQQSQVGTLHAMTTANGMDTRSHQSGETARRSFEEEGPAEAAPDSEADVNERQLVTENQNMSTEWAEDAKDAANDLFEHYADGEEGEDGDWDVDHAFDGARADGNRAVANGREAFVLMTSSVMKDDSTLGTNAFSHHGDQLKAAVDVVGDGGVSDETKETVQYLHDKSEDVDGVESPWDGDGPFADTDYDDDDVRARLISNRLSGSGVDNRFL